MTTTATTTTMTGSASTKASLVICSLVLVAIATWSSERWMLAPFRALQSTNTLQQSARDATVLDAIKADDARDAADAIVDGAVVAETTTSTVAATAAATETANAAAVPSETAEQTSDEAPTERLPVRTETRIDRYCLGTEYDEPRTVQYDPDVTLDLKVPFYVYDNELNMANMTSCGEPIGRSWYTYFKHADDYWLLQSALVHPMRTHDPEEAKLFFVPTLMNALCDSFIWYNRYYCIHDGKTCFDKTVSPHVGFDWVDQALGRSEYFQRSKGADHILVLSHYLTQNIGPFFMDLENLMLCNRITFHNFAQRRENSQLPPRLEMPHLYIANKDGCKPTTPGQKNADFAMIASLKPHDPNFRDRSNVCNWLKDGNYSYDVCGKGDMCPYLADAKFGLHVRGDDVGAHRPFETVASGTVPLFTLMEQYDLMPPFAPFEEMSFFVNVSTPETFHASLQAVLAVSDEEYNAKLAAIAKYANFVDVKTGVPFDAYMTHFARGLKLQD